MHAFPLQDNNNSDQACGHGKQEEYSKAQFKPEDTSTTLNPSSAINLCTTDQLKIENLNCTPLVSLRTVFSKRVTS